MDNHYRLTQHADRDIQKIIRYTLDEWGKKQTLNYVNSLENCFNKIYQKRVRERCLFIDYPDLFVTRCQHHYIFYIRKETKPNVVIIAILHENMDLLANIKGRKF